MRTLLVALAVSLSLPAVTPPALAQGDLDEYQRGLAFRMLQKVRKVIQDNYWDPKFGGKNLDQLEYQAQSAIERATDRAQAFGAVAQFVAGLEDSHTRFFPPGLTVEVDYGWDWQMVGDDCYVVAVDKGSDAERRGLRPGDKVIAIDGLRPMRANIRVIHYVYHFLRPRQGMALNIERPDGTPAEIVFEAKLKRLPPEFRVTDLEQMRAYSAAHAGSGVRHDWKVRDSVAIWRFSGFGLRDDRLDRYMREARGYPWLILDLRGNGGGYIEALTRFLGHFTDTTFVAYTETYRDSTVAHTVEPRGGGKYAGQVLVLVDSRSASSSEITARTLQRMGHMVIGDRTMGAVVTAISGSLAEEASGHTVVYGLQLTVTDVTMPDSTRLEGVGVIPNVPAIPTGADLVAGRDPAMQFALEMAGIRVSAEQAGRIWK